MRRAHMNRDTMVVEEKETNLKKTLENEPS
jgi:hypothetical protein